jgi:SAM-dependent methyltransferase
MSGGLQPTTRFSGRAADYVRARPTYPDSLVDLLEADLGLSPGNVMADIGSGTGLSAEPFLRRGYSVICVEPNPDMRAAAERQLGDYAGFRSIAGSAEATGLPPSSVDCVVVAQAFHWFDADAAKAEFARILRAGWVILMWNTRRTEGSTFLQGYERLIQEFGTDYPKIRQRTARLTTGSAATDRVLDRFFAGAYERRVLENWQDLDLDGLKSRVVSASYMPAVDSPAFAPMTAALARLYEANSADGRVRLEYDLEVYCGRVA